MQLYTPESVAVEEPTTGSAHEGRVELVYKINAIGSCHRRRPGALPAVMTSAARRPVRPHGPPRTAWGAVGREVQRVHSLCLKETAATLRSPERAMNGLALRPSRKTRSLRCRIRTSASEAWKIAWPR